MDSRRAFLAAASTFVYGYTELVLFRITGNQAIISVLDVNVVNAEKYVDVDLPVIRRLKDISAREFRTFEAVFQESSMVLAFSWLESFLEEVETALYLWNPTDLGESTQVKLGKILTAGTFEELLHDLVRRRVREQSKRSLVNRLDALRSSHDFRFTSSDSDIEWISRIRNLIVHERSLGFYSVKQGKLSYELPAARAPLPSPEVDRFLQVATNCALDLYFGTCRSLKITRSNSRHRKISDMVKDWRTTWHRPSTQSPNTDEDPRIPAEPFDDE
jgi:hypothetical protein